MKVRTLMVTAVAAVGAVALSAPAFAAPPSNGGVPSIDSQLSQLTAAGKAAKARARTSSKWTKGIDKSIDSANTSITRLGNNVYDLRKANDQTNWTISQIAGAAISALTQLQAGLVQVAAVTTNFKYGVIQVCASAAGYPCSAGFGPALFYVTPPIQLTGAQSTVSFPLPSAGGAGTQLWAAVRSLNPDSGAVECRVSIMAADGVLRYTVGDGSGGWFAKMPQSRLTPQNGDTSFPLRLIPTEDNTLNLAGTTMLNGGTGFAVAAGTSAQATLSCLRTS